MGAGDLYDAAEAVDSKAAFLDFLAALEADWQARPGEWQNGTVPDFLAACLRWAEATSALTRGPTVGEAATWAAFAQILHAGKVYE